MPVKGRASGASSERTQRIFVEAPVRDAAFAAGRLSYSKVRALTRVATAETQGELLELAEHVPAGGLAHALAAWRMQRETPAETEARQEANMALWWSDDADGMGVLTVRLPPAEMAYVRAAVEGRRGRAGRTRP